MRTIGLIWFDPHCLTCYLFYEQFIESRIEIFQLNQKMPFNHFRKKLFMNFEAVNVFLCCIHLFSIHFHRTPNHPSAFLYTKRRPQWNWNVNFLGSHKNPSCRSQSPSTAHRRTAFTQTKQIWFILLPLALLDLFFILSTIKCEFACIIAWVCVCLWATPFDAVTPDIRFF